MVRSTFQLRIKMRLRNRSPYIETYSERVNEVKKSHWRRKLSVEDPQCYEFFKSLDDACQRERRAKWSDERKEKERCASRERIALSRARKIVRESEEAERQAALLKDKCKRQKVTKPMTRAENNEKNLQRQKSRNYQREREPKLTPQQKWQINEKRRLNRAEERRLILKYRWQRIEQEKHKLAAEKKELEGKNTGKRRS